MSGAALGWAKAQAAPTRIAKAVLICLADYADPDHCAWPSIGTLASEVQASERTIQRALRSLEEAGLIEVSARTRKDGGATSNAYRFPITPGDSVSPPRCQDVTPPVTLLSPATEPLSELLPSDEGRKRAPVVSVEPIAKAIWLETPKLGRQRSSMADLKDALTAAANRGRDLSAIPPAIKAAYASKAYEDDNAKGVHRLVEKDRWMSFVEDAAPPARSFTGPAELRASVVSERDESFALRWLDSCGWRQADRTLLAPNVFVASNLTRDLAAWLVRTKVKVEVAAANDPKPNPHPMNGEEAA